MPAQIRQLIFITNIKNQLTDLCGNELVHNKFINTFCEIILCSWLCVAGVRQGHRDSRHPLVQIGGWRKEETASFWRAGMAERVLEEEGVFDDSVLRVSLSHRKCL